jgi:hypothetical protein
MKATLKKDIIIPAGTVFYTAPVKTERVGDDHIEFIFGLSKDTSGSIHYCLGNTKEERDQIAEYFEIN